MSSPCHVLVESSSLSATTNGDEIRAFARCRNERLRLPAFLDHYRRLGVSGFYIVDNDSSDGSADYLAAQSDVRLFRTSGRFSESGGGTTWLNALLAEFGVGCWCVTVDIDELIAYPGSETATLPTLIRYLDSCRVEALACMLLDLYPPGAIKDCVYAPGDDLLAASPYFDPGPYEITPYEACPPVHIHGGVRERVFYPEFKAHRPGAKLYDVLFHVLADHFPRVHEMPWVLARRPPTPPLLSKIPLVRWDASTRYLKNNHRITPKRVAVETGVLLHFKLLHDFHARAVVEARRREYSSGAFDYRRYAARLEKNPGMSFMYEGSTRFENTAQLVDLGLMHDTAAWRAYRATDTR